MADLNLEGLAVVVVFYLLIVVVGFAASRCLRFTGDDDSAEMSMVAGRNLGLFIGIFTMAATSVGGGYLSGTTEGVATAGYGIAWTVFPVSIVLAFTIGSLVYAKPMRRKKYLTVLDPLQQKFGDVMTGILLLGELFAELMWGASILIALGTSLSVIISLDVNISIIVSAAVALLYTCFGKMVSVAYTDVIQLSLVAIGMALCVPFAMTNENVGNFSSTSDVWLGSIPANMTAVWADYVVAQTLGGIPWNTYMMRLLSAKSVRHAQIVSIAGGIVSLLMAVPPVLLGVVGVSTNWTSTEYGVDPIAEGDVASLMPLVINYLTPKAVAIIALSAIVAAVMSSMDSIILSSSSMFTYNIYKSAIRKRAGDLEIKIVQVLSMISVGVTATVLAILVDTIYGIFILTADIVYVVIFPQFTCAVFIPHVNPYGSFVGFAVGTILRFGGGEPSLSLDPFIKYPFYDEALGQLFPFKTFAMVLSFVAIVSVSYIFKVLFERKILPSSLEITGKVLVFPSDGGVSFDAKQVYLPYYDSSTTIIKADQNDSEVEVEQTKL